MGVSIFTTTAYMDMVHHGGTAMTPRLIDGVVTWSVPLGDGAVPHIALEDVGFYVRWIFDNPARSNGLNLEVSTEHVHYADMAAAFERVTGKPARYVDVGVEEYFAAHPRFGDGLVGEGAREGAALTWRQNFEAFWNLFRHSGGNTGVLKRDYALLDEIHPGRIKSVEEYFRRHQEGLWESVQPENIKTVLKATEDIEALK